MTCPPEPPRILPAHRAFVVQFRHGTELAQGQCEGRVEHVVSGQAALFHTWDALLAFMTRVLRDHEAR